MKVEFKQNCEIEGKKFGFEKHLKPGIHEVPASFIFNWFFVALVLDKKAKILDAHYSEFESEEFSDENLKKIKPEFLELLSKFLENEEESAEDESQSEGEEESAEDESQPAKAVLKKKKKGKR